MLQTYPLSHRSRVLLLQIHFHCQAARRQLVLCRAASTHAASESAPTRKSSSPPPPPKQTHPPPQKPTTPPASASSLASIPAPAINPILNPFATDKDKDDDRSVKPLSRPLGLSNPPHPDQNTGIDTRTWRERRDDFFNYDKHLERRKVLTKQVATPYFREWTNLQYAKGKTFLSPPSLIRASKALFFPNLHGITLASRTPTPTTPLLTNHISIISLFSGTWAERQTATFVSPSINPALQKLLKELEALSVDTSNPAPAVGVNPPPTSVPSASPPPSPALSPVRLIQSISLSIEPNPLRAFLVRLFLPRLRRLNPSSNWDKYFLITRGITTEMREALGVGNSKVGYVYLVDTRCRVRWAGSGRAEKREREGLVKGVGRLVTEWKKESGVEMRREEEAFPSASPPPV